MWALLEKVFSQGGLNALLLLISLYGCYRLVLFVMTRNEGREEWLKKFIETQNIVISGQTEALNEHTAQAREFHAEIKSAHEYQRKEHEDMCKRLGSIDDKIVSMR